MCFSPEASFTASAVLLTAGIIAIRESRLTYKLPFAVIPIFFSLQQFSEGVLWVALQRPEFAHWQHVATISFLIFAQVVWPLWVPLSMLAIEKKQLTIKALAILTLFGFLISGYLLYCILVFKVLASTDCFHIYY